MCCHAGISYVMCAHLYRNVNKSELGTVLIQNVGVCMYVTIGSKFTNTSNRLIDNFSIVPESSGERMLPLPWSSRALVRYVKKAALLRWRLKGLGPP